MVDLHTHSTMSDGSDRPAAVVEAAERAGCSAVALTDHDTLDGLHEASDRANTLGVELVPGCELSCVFGPGTMHLLVYFVEPGHGPLQDELAILQRVRQERNLRLIERLNSIGLAVSYDEVSDEAGGVGIGRPHVAAVLVRKHYASSVQDAFGRYLAKGKPGYVEKERLEPERALSLVAASGGVSVLAHPWSMGLDHRGTARVIRDLRGAGLAGIEARYGRYSREQRLWLTELAERLDLVATGGSDYHGSYKPDLAVGVGTGDLDVPDEVLKKLSARR